MRGYCETPAARRLRPRLATPVDIKRTFLTPLGFFFYFPKSLVRMKLEYKLHDRTIRLQAQNMFCSLGRHIYTLRTPFQPERERLETAQLPNYGIK